jgi:hypothetical protein
MWALVNLPISLQASLGLPQGSTKVVSGSDILTLAMLVKAPHMGSFRGGRTLLFTARVLRSGKLLLYIFGNRCCSMPALSNRWNNSDSHRTIVVIVLLGDSSFDTDTTPGGK